jgi:signal peptidase II
MIFYLAAVLCTAGLVFIDQMTKRWAVNVLLPQGTMDFIRIKGLDIIGFRYAENTGAAFSSFSNGGIVLTTVISLILLAVTLYALFDRRKSFFKSVCFIMIIGGGIGNLIDRLRNGFVVDFLEVRLFDFAIFNFADILVVVGTIMHFIYFIYEEINNDKKRAMRLRAEIRNKRNGTR